MYQTADKVNDTQPIPGDELLTNGVTYYVGGESGTCDRIAVTATVTSVTAPTNTIFPNSNSFSISPCSSTNFSASDLASYFQATEAGYTVEVYDSEFGTDPFTGELVPGESYFVGQVDTSGGVGCPSARASVGYDPMNPEAPQADANQSLCQGSTVADLSASGTYPNTQAIRWYRSQDANSPLPSDTQLLNNQIYYASQVVNDRNSVFPPCESGERTAVKVTLTEGNAGNPNTGIICESDVQDTFPSIDAIKNYYLSLLDDGVPATGTFNPTPAQLAQQYQNDADGLGDFTTTYTLGADECGASVQLTASIVPSQNADAGPDVEKTYTIDDGAQDLYTLIPAGTNTDGYFEGYPDGTFNPSQEGSGVYNITYTVDETTGCITGSDSATYTITVTDCSANAGADINKTLCSAQAEEFASNPSAALAYFSGLIEDGVDTSGDFNPSLATIGGQWMTDPIGTFTTTYTVTDGACSDSAQITINVVEGDANAGSPNTGIVCLADVQSTFPSIDEIRKYYLSLLDPGVSQKGTFDPGPAQLADIYQNDADGLGDFTTTYTVGEAGSCTASVDLTVRIVESVDAGENGSVTLNENDDPINLFDYLGGTPDEGGSWSQGDGTFDPSTDTPGDYTYTIGSESCQDSAVVSVTVTSEPVDPCDGLAGNDNTTTLCESAVQATFPSIDEIRKYYLSLLDAGVSRTGTLNPSASQLATMYQNDEDGLGDFTTTYTLTEGDCTDSVQLTVTIIPVQEANAGTIDDLVVCSNEDDIKLYSLLSEDASPDGVFTGYENGIFSPSENGAGTYDITYVVNEDVSCVTGEDSTSFTIEVNEAPNAGADISEQYCITEVEGMITTPQDAINFFTSLLGENTPQDGTFKPSLETLATQYASNPIGTFKTVYTVSNDACEDSSNISVTINDTVPAEAGDDVEVTFCTQQGAQNLYTYLPENANPDGTFEGLDGGMFDPSSEGDFEVTYTVDETTGCVTGTDSSVFTIHVQDVSGLAGGDNSKRVCSADAEALFPDVASVRNFYLDMLDQGVDQNGTFSPSITDLIAAYQDDNIGDFSTTYTVGAGDCSDSAVLTATILQAPNAGEDMVLPVCTNQDTINLFERLSADADTTGEFDLDGTVLTEGKMNPSDYNAGTYTVIYTVPSNNEVCSNDTAEFTVTINEVPATPDATDLEFCAVNAPTGADLTPAGDDLTWYADAELNNMVAADDALESGDYYVTSTNGDCESDATMINVTINDPDAPSIDLSALELCEFEDNTIADLNAAINENAEITWYASEESTTPLSLNTALEDGVSYFATLKDAGTGCESARRLRVTVELKECDLVFPEGISPNNDQLNDEFVIKKIGEKYPNYMIEIYNRWGNLVYKGNASTPNWDGTSNQSGTLGNDILPVGIYFYVVEFNDGVTPAKQGKIYLSR